MEFNRDESPLLIVLSGPSGVGKDSVLDSMKKQSFPLHYSVTMTTRAMRDGEKDGVDYHFVSKEKFERLIQENELLEWANVYGNLYGVPKRQIRDAMADGNDAIIKIDVQGAATIRRNHPEAVLIFLVAPSVEELEKRLMERKTESNVDLKLRIQAAREEMKSLYMFDYIVVNHRDQVESAASQVASIITAEKCRVGPRTVAL